jgi:hypothetical protein
VRVVGDRLRDVAGHRGDVDRQGREGRGVAVDPVDAVGSGLGTRDVERRSRRIDGYNLESGRGEEQREAPCAAADVENTRRPELVHDAGVDVEVAPIGVERVLEGGEPRMLVDRVGHSVREPVGPNQLRLPHLLA